MPVLLRCPPLTCGMEGFALSRPRDGARRGRDSEGGEGSACLVSFAVVTSTPDSVRF